MTSYPRVLFVLGANGVGGTELQARALIAGLQGRGVGTTVLLLDGSHGLEGLPSETRVLAANRPNSLGALITYGKAVWLIRRWLRSGRFDVVHGIHARGYTVMTAAAVGLQGIRRVAWRRNMGIHVTGPKMLVAKLLERASLRATDVVVANSADVRDYWVAQYGLSSGKTLVIPNLLQDWRFEVQRAPVSDRMRIVAVGGLKPVKGHDVLLRAVSALERPDVEVAIIGSGECRPALERIATELGVKLILPGMHPDPRPWLATATLYVHPSLSEGASNAVLEAMAAGLAVVASDVGGMSELLGSTARLVPPGDVESLRDAISQLLASPSNRERLGAEARRRAKQRFSEDAVISKTIKVYEGELPCADS